MRRFYLLRRLFRRVFPPLAIFTLVLLSVLQLSLPLDSAWRAAVRFNVARATLALRGTGTARDAWLARPPRFPLDSRDVAIIVKSGYVTRARVPAQLEALGLMSRGPVYARDDEKNTTSSPSSSASSYTRSSASPGNLPVAAAAEASKLAVQKQGYDGAIDGRPGKPVPQDSFLVISDFAPNGGSLDGVEFHDIWEDVMHRVAPRLVNAPRFVKYKSLAVAIEEGYSEKAKLMAEVFGWELDASKFLIGLETAYAQMPDRKWYVVIDDETYLVQSSLRRVLGHLDPSQPVYIGNPVGDFKGRYAHGASAVILSAEAVRRLVTRRDVLDEAHLRSMEDLGGEKILAATLQKLGVYLDEGYAHMFDLERPRPSRVAPDQFCAPVVCFHGLVDESEMRQVGIALRGATDVLRYGDLWRMHDMPDLAALPPGQVLLDRDHLGWKEDADRLNGVESPEACWAACKRAGRRCAAWTWERSTHVCWTAPWFVVGDQYEGMASGLNAEYLRELTRGCPRYQ